MGPVLVFGHRNPDNDSICSAVAYAHLKNVTHPASVYLPARLGPTPPETAWVFGRFGVDLPDEVHHVHTRVRDAMSVDVVSVDEDENLLAAGERMREHGVRALPVLDASGVVRGLLNQSILAELYIGDTGRLGFEAMPVTVGRLVDVLGGALLAGDASLQLTGHVLIGAMEPETMASYIRTGDTLIVGDRVRTQARAIEAGAACLIVTGGSIPPPGVLALAASRGAAIVSSPHNTYTTARLVNLSHAVSRVMDAAPLLVSPDALLAEVAEDLMDSVHREAIVIDEEGRPLGILTRTNLARGIRRRVILVDHNEIAQSAAGVESASVVEIVDHHRVGDVQTSAPILFLNVPVGSTATIVAERYRELDVTPPDGMAGIMLSAVLTDTVLLKSPTATDTDRAVAERLAGQLGIDAIELGLELFRARTAGRAFSAEEAVSTDLKEYRAGDLTIGVAQVETVDAEWFLGHRDELKATLEALRERRGYDLAVLLVTDVLREGSHVFAAGKVRVAERGLGVSLSEGPAWMPGVLSRKKQVASPLLEVTGA